MSTEPQLGMARQAADAAGCRVVIVHYHLRPGGVATVIRRHAAALAAMGHDVYVAVGEPGDVPGARVVVLPELGYSGQMSGNEAAELAGSLRRLAGGGVLHLHNPTLGKSVRWPAMVRILAADGQPMLLHVHDFIEDGRLRGRAGTGDRQDWYPVGPHVRWLVLNPAAAAALRNAGMPAGHVAVELNPVEALPVPDIEPVRGMLLAPTRGIPRKNLGELLLLAALAPEPWHVAGMLVPADAGQRWRMMHWQVFARRKSLRVALGEGLSAGRPEQCVSTSIQEGFGYAMAEPWLAGIPATGRWLGDAMGVLSEAGWDPGGAYRTISLPSAWVDCVRLHEEVRRACACPDGPAADEVIAALYSGDQLDYGRLPATVQRAVLRRLLAAPKCRGELVLHGADDVPRAPEQWFAGLAGLGARALPGNRMILETRANPTAVARAMRGHYAAVLHASPGLQGYADEARVGRAFAAPSRFHFHRPSL